MQLCGRGTRFFFYHFKVRDRVKRKMCLRMGTPLCQFHSECHNSIRATLKRVMSQTITPHSTTPFESSRRTNTLCSYPIHNRRPFQRTKSDKWNAQNMERFEFPLRLIRVEFSHLRLWFLVSQCQLACLTERLCVSILNHTNFHRRYKIQHRKSFNGNVS